MIADWICRRVSSAMMTGVVSEVRSRRSSRVRPALPVVSRTARIFCCVAVNFDTEGTEGDGEDGASNLSERCRFSVISVLFVLENKHREFFTGLLINN